MIEVEKKFQISNESISLLKKNSIFINEISFHDTYFDDEDYILTSNDKWLRKRDNKYELKIPLHKSLKRSSDQYEEITKEEEIIKILNFQENKSLSHLLKKNKFFPFCSFITTRQKYKNEKFNIDFDIVNFFDFSYSIVEIELMIDALEKIPIATKEIIDFANKYSLQSKPTNGKVAEYLKHKNPSHYKILIEKKVLKKI